MSGECSCKPHVIGRKCNSCEEGFYLLNPSSPDGCQACNCNLGGSSSRLCDMYSGQCSCRQGLTGQTCSDVIPGYFIPSVDYLILEGEQAAVAGAQVVISTKFSGVQVTDESSTISFGVLTPPMSGFYDVVIRYSLRGILTWSTASLDISSGGEEGNGPTMCRSTSEINGTVRLDYTFWTMGYELSMYQRVCLRGGRSYSFELRDFDSGRMNSTAILNVDSLVLIFINSSTLIELLGVQIFMEYSQCVSYYRSLSAMVSADPSCEQTIMLVSTALYSGALSEISLHLACMWFILLLLQDVTVLQLELWQDRFVFHLEDNVPALLMFKDGNVTNVLLVSIVFLPQDVVVSI